jgi:hypothetical protein
MFWTNLKAIIDNLPLILSDTKDPSDVSFTRVFAMILAIFIMCTSTYTIFFKPTIYYSIAPFITQGLNSILLLVGGNIVKRGIDTAGNVINNRNVPPLPPK